METTRLALTVVIDLARIGAEWAATSPQIDGFRVYADDREAVEAAAREKLAGWLGSHVTLEFRVVP